MEASRNKVKKNSRIPDTVESLREVDRSKNRPRARRWLGKSIQNELRKIKSLIESRPSRAGRERMEMTPEKRVDEIKRYVQKALKHR